MFGVLKKMFGTAQDRLLKRYRKLVLIVNEWDEKFKSLSDEELKNKTVEFRRRLGEGEKLDDLLPEAYAVVKNGCRRLCGTEVHVSGYDQKWDMVPYDVQILGGIALYYGAVAEMQTGEGKTLTAAMPLYLNALTQKPVHLVTVNDYLAQRDCAWVGTIFRFLGVTVEPLTHQTPSHLRHQVYQADIVYGTASEFGFDYLRDNSMAQSKEEQCQRGHFFAIIDEVDSILIDEARTPLIISGPCGVSKQLYDTLKDDVAAVVREQRDLCNRLATDARRTLETLGRLTEGELPKLNKEQEACEKEAFRKLWLVGKGTPQNKILKRLRENPEMKASIEKWDIYFYGEGNKEEKAAALAELLIVVDERASEFELTDKGIATWIRYAEGSVTHDDFMMLDLGHEYALIDQDLTLTVDEKIAKKVTLREEDSRRKERAHNLRQLFRSHLLMEKDVDYIVVDEKIVIIDENTGRPQPGRRFSDGLHQAIEAKEGVAIQGETQTYATITLQNYFRLYTKLSGMTGTAMTEAAEFKEIYKLEVLAIPTHRPCKRTDSDDQIYMTEREKYNALIADIQKIHQEGRPILIGTESVDVSEKLSRILKQNKLEHTVLNAKNHAHEAEIIAEAGKASAITVATNMAGRGTDIKLKPGVAEIGGLHVIGTTRHQSRRIDRQLRGRGARLGDPGSSKFYVSFEDALMRLFTSPRLTSFLQRFRPPEGEPIAASVLNKSIETAQKRVEQRNYTMRKHTLEYDDVMNKQRSEMYAFRNELLYSDQVIEIAEDLLGSLCLQMARKCYSSRSSEGGWHPEAYHTWLMETFPLTFDMVDWTSDYLEVTDLEQKVQEAVVLAFQQKVEHQCRIIQEIQEKMDPDGNFKDPRMILIDVMRTILVRIVDKMWQEHLLQIDYLRTEVTVRSVGNKDPLLEFKHEAFSLFDKLGTKMKGKIAHGLFKFEMVVPKIAPKPVEPKLFDFATRRPKIDLSRLSGFDAKEPEPVK